MTPADGGAVALRGARRAANLTQERLADLAGLHVRTVRGLEIGKITRPRRYTVELLVAALGLAPHDRQEFFEAWRLRDRANLFGEAGAFGAGDETANLLDRLTQLSRATASTLVARTTMQIGSDRLLSYDQAEDLIIARVDRLERRYVFSQPDPAVDLTRLRMTDLENCELAAEYVFAEQGIKVFEVMLDRTLHRGETSLTRFRLDHRSAYRTDRTPELTTECVQGFLRPINSLIMQVCFEDRTLPHLCERAYLSRPTAVALGTHDPLPITSVGSTHLAVLNPTSGAHGIRWKW